ncbi:AraC family transcriptional regulator [Exiguobacterium sp. RIT452]|uniref:helix-turn-helix transcriptional regulator n=1 Tax=Exiguobacterium sp. RIT452 TaxID=2315552 RepID=UPI000E73B342|nr:AraC family transcriptional regulator [Exiguobacterium sp. RIT452]RJP02627.1 AraC family transcriptional regulator [Exiguobacterium sp. RIT452]
MHYIETHLYADDLSEQLPAFTQYSPFHFGRLFKKRIGQTVGDYIRTRRVTDSARLLRLTEIEILELAFHCGYQSQEAFTRVFKGQYGLPPRRYRQIISTLTDKERQHMQTNQLTGWFMSGTHTEEYHFETDSEIVHQGVQSGKLRHVSDGSATGKFATMMQSIQAVDYRGKRMMFAGFLKTEATGRAGAWFRVDDISGDPLQFDNMSDRSLTGETDWTYCAIVLDVPDEALSLHFGFLLEEAGTVWADSFSFHEVETNIPSTNQLGQTSLPRTPVNLTFDERE